MSEIEPGTNPFDYRNRELLKDAWTFIYPYRKQFLWGSIARFTSDLVWLFPPWALSQMITFAANHRTGESTAYAWELLAAIFVVGIYHFIFHEVAKHLVFQVGEYANLDAQKRALRHLFSIDLRWHERENSGNKIQRIRNGGESLNKMIRIYVSLVIESSLNLVAILLILSSLNLYFALVLIFFFATYSVLSYRLTRKPVAQSHVVNLELENFSGLAFESINNIAIVKSLRLGDRIFPILAGITDRLAGKIRERIYLFRVRSGILSLYQEFFRIIIIAFTLWQIFLGHLEVGTLAMVLLYFGKIVESASEFAETYSEFVTARIGMYRMKQILETEPVIENSGVSDFSHGWRELRFDNVTFAYHGQYVLKDFSLTITRGEKIGIVGISGAGKTTLFKLLLKLYDEYVGEILFDDLPLRDIRRASYVERIAVVPQETELFNLSLADNITFSQEQRDAERLDDAIEIAHVRDFIHKLPQGVDTLVGEKGIKLSGGEKQRVGIARAVYRRPEILLLDEATSHLDVESEKSIQEALHTFFKSITAIVAAHRLSTIREMDRIIVMGEGKVLEMGSFHELIQRRGAFYQMWERQKLSEE